MESHSQSGHSTSNLPKITGPVELLTSSWNFFTDNWKVLAPIAALPSIFTYLGNIVIYTKNPFAIVLGVVLAIAGFIISIVMVPALLTTIHSTKILHGINLPLIETYKRSFKYFWWFILISIINSLVGLGSFLLFIIPGIIVSIYGGFYLYAYIIDGKKGFSAFTESYSLVYGRWFPVLGRFLFLVLVLLITFLIVGLIFGLIEAILGISSDVTTSIKNQIPSLKEIIISGMVNIIYMAIAVPVTITYTYQMFSSLKTHRLHNISTDAFKKWLIAFLVIGIIAIPLIIGGSIVAVSYFQDKIKTSLSQNTAIKQQAFQTIEKALMDQNTPESAELLNKFRENIKKIQSGTPVNTQ